MTVLVGSVVASVVAADMAAAKVDMEVADMELVVVADMAEAKVDMMVDKVDTVAVAGDTVATVPQMEVVVISVQVLALVITLLEMIWTTSLTMPTREDKWLSTNLVVLCFCSRFCGG
jgi:hypothetical protein